MAGTAGGPGAFLKQLATLSQTRDITLCGETGECHTLVVNGPLFKQRMEILESRKVLREGYCFLEISETALRDK